MHAGGQRCGFEAEKGGGAVGTVDFAAGFGERVENQAAFVLFDFAE